MVDGYFDGPLNDPPDIRFVSAAGGERHSVACDSEGRVWIAGVGDGAGDPRMLYQNDDDDPTLHREGMSLMRTKMMWESIDPRLRPSDDEKYPRVVSVAAGNNHTVLMTIAAISGHGVIQRMVSSVPCRWQKSDPMTTLSRLTSWMRSGSRYHSLPSPVRALTGHSTQTAESLHRVGTSNETYVPKC